MKLRIIFVLGLLVAFANNSVEAQTCPANYIPKPTQNCVGAIPLCNLSTTYPTGFVCGPGTIPGEIPAGSCLSSDERNTTWYVFKVSVAGKLRFKIKPLDVTGTSSGSTDYDWAVFKLPTGQINSVAACATISANVSTQFSCNYSAERGVTGMYDTTGTSQLDIQDATGTKFNRPRDVFVGETYLLAVDNFSGGDQIGYTVTFMNPIQFQGTASIVPAADTIGLQAITQAPSCTTNQLIFSFDRSVPCDSVQPNKFKINGANPPYTITSITPVACSGSFGLAQSFYLTFTPSVGDTSYQLVSTTRVRDICQNFTISDSVPFRIHNSSTALIKQVGSQLVANYATGATYQWFLDGWQITGATSRTTTPMAIGTYKVVITQPNCVATSNEITLTTVSIKQNLSDMLSIYPNPSTGIFQLEIKDLSEISVSDVTGKLLAKFTMEGTKALDLSKEARGLYFVKVSNKQGTITKKIVLHQ